MNRIAAAVAVASLLTASVALAEPTNSQSEASQAPKAQASNNSEGRQVLGSFRGSYSSDPRSGPLSPVRGTFRGSYSSDPHTGPWSNVETSFQDSYVGD